MLGARVLGQESGQFGVVSLRCSWFWILDELIFVSEYIDMLGHPSGIDQQLLIAAESPKGVAARLNLSPPVRQKVNSLRRRQLQASLVGFSKNAK